MFTLQSCWHWQEIDAAALPLLPPRCSAVAGPPRMRSCSVLAVGIKDCNPCSVRCLTAPVRQNGVRNPVGVLHSPSCKLGDRFEQGYASGDNATSMHCLA